MLPCMLASLMLIHLLGADPGGPKLTEDAASFTEAVAAAYRAQDPLDVVVAGEPARTACTRDAACLTRLADAAGARLVALGNVWPSEGQRGVIVSLDLFDVRTGKYAGRETVQAQSRDEAKARVEVLVGALLQRTFLNRERAHERVRVLVLRVTPRTPADAVDETRPFSMVLASAGGLGVSAAAALLGSAALLAYAYERDAQAQAARYQIDAYRRSAERNNATLAAMVISSGAGGALLLAVMTSSYWVVHESGWF